MSRYANRIVHKMGICFRYKKNSRLDITDLAILRTWLCFFEGTRPECRIERFHTSGNQKKKDCFNVDGYCDHCKTVFQIVGCYYHFVPARRLVSHWLIWKLNDVTKGEISMTWDGCIFAKKDTKLKRCGNVRSGKTSNWTKKLQITSVSTFPTKD